MTLDPADRARLDAIVAATLDVSPADLHDGTNAKNTPEWDSLAHMMILDAIEKAFARKLPRLAAYRVQSLGELAALLAARPAEQTP